MNIEETVLGIAVEDNKVLLVHVSKATGEITESLLLSPLKKEPLQQLIMSLIQLETGLEETRVLH